MLRLLQNRSHVGRLGEEDSQELDRGEERQKYRKGERRCEVKGQQERETKDRQGRPAAVRPRLTAFLYKYGNSQDAPWVQPRWFHFPSSDFRLSRIRDSNTRENTPQVSVSNELGWNLKATV